MHGDWQSANKISKGKLSNDGTAPVWCATCFHLLLGLTTSGQCCRVAISELDSFNSSHHLNNNWYKHHTFSVSSRKCPCSLIQLSQHQLTTNMSTLTHYTDTNPIHNQPVAMASIYILCLAFLSAIPIPRLCHTMMSCLHFSLQNT